MKQTLTIAGLDSLAGGGITADLKTFEEFQTFGHAVLTCVAAINESVTIFDLPQSVIAEQIASIQSYAAIDAVKIGLLHQTETIEQVHGFLRTFSGPVVLDPVFAFKEGDTPYNKAYQEALLQLFPYATIVTPNLIEAQQLTGMLIQDKADMKKAAKIIKETGTKNVLIKGGARFSTHSAYDLLYDGHDFFEFEAEKLAKTTTNGAGCSLSSALTALLANGEPILKAVDTAKAFVLAGIKDGLSLKNDFGNVDQTAYFRREESYEN